MSFRLTPRLFIRILLLFVCVAQLFAVGNAIFDYPKPKAETQDGISCERLSMTNQTKILCHTRTNVDSLEKLRKYHLKHKDGRVCTKIFKLTQRLQFFEEGNFRYCDPARCLRESRHCRGGKMTPECNLCLGKCWVQYSYPQETTGGLQFRSFPCDPTVCGKEVFCGGWDMKTEKKPTMNHRNMRK
ncbi:hypothetical protein BIW11_11215 [Tropilaelaps mercedesae]|uniref:Uncharacterized protein n=1 Tax=Tropilaelaps mercedesae TaxID=418985 RepID=A0A1V9XCL0_9ACAR|nr:hypothetical protein BIW11_11215 [Tropilaelaps mercedesae]